MSVVDHARPVRPGVAGAPPAPRVLCRIGWLVVLLQLAWCGFGIWPTVPVEGDDQGVLFGLEGMVRDDPLRLQARYLYEVQPGSYCVMAAISRLTGASAETVFGAVTIIGAMIFALTGAALLQRLLGWPFGWALAGMLGCQEVTTAAFYMNTSALAGGVALAGLLCAQSRGRWGWVAAGLLLAIAGWIRADSLLVAPACLGLAWGRFGAWRPAILWTGSVALLTLGTVVALYWWSGTSVGHGASSYAGRGLLLSGWRTLLETSLMLLSPLLGLTALAGVLRLGWLRQWVLLVTLAGGVLPSVAVYGFSLTTPKYFYYLVPFAVAPACFLLGDLLQRLARLPRPRAWLAGLALAALVLADGLLGVRSLSPRQRLFTTAPTWVTLGTFARPEQKDLALVFGPGELVFNADAFRLRTGQWFAPWCWRREKLRMQEDLATLRSWLGTNQDLILLWADWLPRQAITRELFAAGFRPELPYGAVSGYHVWRRGGQLAQVDYLPYADADFPPPAQSLAHAVAPLIYFAGDQGRHPLVELADGRHWKLLSAAPEGFISLYRRQ